MIFEISKGLAFFESYIDLLRRTPLFYITIAMRPLVIPDLIRDPGFLPFQNLFNYQNIFRELKCAPARRLCGGSPESNFAVGVTVSS